MNPDSQRIKRLTLRDQVYSELRNMILINEYPAGSRLNECDLAKRLGVSVTPVREALNKLRGDGLIYSDPRQGSFVRNFSDDDIRNILDIRCALEVLAMEQAFPRFTAGDIAELERIQRAYADAYATSPPDYEQAAMWNVSFHDFIVDKSVNPWAKDMLDSINTHCSLARAPLTRTSDGKSSILEHREIIDALKAKEFDRTTRGVRRHIGRMKEDLLTARRAVKYQDKEG